MPDFVVYYLRGIAGVKQVVEDGVWALRKDAGLNVAEGSWQGYG